MKQRVALIGLVVSMLLAMQAQAHARLRSSNPAAGAQVSVAPARLELHFNEKVRLASLSLNSEGRVIDVAVDRSAPSSADVSLALPALTAGSYQVHWRALSGGDGHITQGTFSFTITGASKP